jgi:hypothetical protein
MDRIPVTSSTIRAIGYDADTAILEVEFNNGTIYQYSGVPQAEFDAIMASDSKGRYLNANIKGRYSFTKL